MLIWNFRPPADPEPKRFLEGLCLEGFQSTAAPPWRSGQGWRVSTRPRMRERQGSNCGDGRVACEVKQKGAPTLSSEIMWNDALDGVLGPNQAPMLSRSLLSLIPPFGHSLYTPRSEPRPGLDSYLWDLG